MLDYSSSPSAKILFALGRG